ncbi:FAD-dependent monooxygenase [Microbacterium aurum]
MPEVLIVGAGPVGIMLGAELTRRGVEAIVLERRIAVGAASRAIGLHAPVLAALEDGGATERILDGAVRVARGECRGLGADGWERLGTVRFDRLSLRFPFVATLPQPATEAALGHGGAPVVRGETVTAIRRDGDRVRVLSSGAGGQREWDAAVVVVAGGSAARDLVYRPGAIAVRHYPDRYLMVDAPVPERADAETAVVTLAPGGVLESFPLPGSRRRFVAWDRRDAGEGSVVAGAAGAGSGSTGAGSGSGSAGAGSTGAGAGWLVGAGAGSLVGAGAGSAGAESGSLAGAGAGSLAGAAAEDPAARDRRLRRALEERGEADAAASAVGATSFRVRRAVAPRLRRGRVLVVGDAAHEVSPIGGQGLNLGLLDAAGLAPLLTDWLRTGSAPDLDVERWEQRRVQSARIAAGIATLNTALGRPLGRRADAARSAALRVALSGASARVFAHAYAMGFDRGA